MAVKNLVITEHAYKIEMEEKEWPVMACPRCGHMQERKPRTICESCQRFIPSTGARQSWESDTTNKRKNPHAEQFFHDNGLDACPDVKFKVARTKSVALWRFVREFGVFGIIAAVVVVSTPWVGNAMLGKKGMAKLERSVKTTIAVLVSPAPHKQIASRIRK